MRANLCVGETSDRKRSSKHLFRHDPLQPGRGSASTLPDAFSSQNSVPEIFSLDSVESSSLYSIESSSLSSIESSSLSSIESLSLGSIGSIPLDSVESSENSDVSAQSYPETRY